MDKEKQAQKLITLQEDPTLAVFTELGEIKDILQTISDKETPEQSEFPQSMKMELPGVELITIKGQKGDDGKDPTDEHLLELITPLIPDPIKGDDYILTEKDKKEIASKITVPVVEKIIEKTEVIKEQPIEIIKEVAVADTPDEIVNKVNSSEKLITKDKIEGLADIERIAKNNQVPSVGITTTIFSKNGSLVGRAKNINIIEGSQMSVNMYQIGDTMNISFTSTASGGGGTAVPEETPTDTGDHINFTIAHTPLAGTFKLYRGGARQQSGGVDYTLSGTTITLVNILQTGEVLLADYIY